MATSTETELAPLRNPKAPAAQRRPSLAAARICAVRRALFSDDLPVKVNKVAEQPTNVLTLTPDERAQLLSGPVTNIVADGHIVVRKDVPIRALMTSLVKLHDLVQINPQILQFRVHGKVDIKSVERLLDIFTTGDGLKTTEIKLMGKKFVPNVLMYQACLSLGIYYVHIKPLLDAIRAEISARPLTFEEMNTIVNRVPTTDPLIMHLANDLCHRRIKKQISNIETFERWLGHDSKEKLQSEMVGIDQAHRKRRVAFRMKILQEEAKEAVEV
jgi:hypothetical protein